MKKTNAQILICDDESSARRGAMRALGSEFTFVECSNGAECLEALARQTFDLVLLDMRMPVMDGQTTLEAIVELVAPPPVVVITADAGLATAIEALKTGADNFIAKPYEIDHLRHVVDTSLEAHRLKRENRQLNAEVSRLRGSSPLLGESPPIRRVLEAVERVAPTAATVLILGESGTGKELVARRIHELSGVARGPFVTVNCSAIPDALVESELFGHKKGAFTGADRDRTGKFQDADRGTLFLDEIGDMALDAQAKLLRVLQEGEVEPLGGGKTVTVDVRVVAATHRDLKQRVADGTFREDLLFRLKVVDMPMPPLRERAGDIVLLAKHFLDGFGIGKLALSPEAETALAAYRWPGNVRELRNAIERASIFCRDGIVRPEDLPGEVRGDGASASAALSWDPADDFQTSKQKVVERFERDILSSALEKHSGNISKAARELGLHRQNLQQKLKQLDIAAESFRN